jgi:hypothetical protein
MKQFAKFLFFHTHQLDTLKLFKYPDLVTRSEYMTSLQGLMPYCFEPTLDFVDFSTIEHLWIKRLYPMKRNIVSVHVDKVLKSITIEGEFSKHKLVSVHFCTQKLNLVATNFPFSFVSTKFLSSLYVWNYLGDFQKILDRLPRTLECLHLVFNSTMVNGIDVTSLLNDLPNALKELRIEKCILPNLHYFSEILLFKVPEQMEVLKLDMQICNCSHKKIHIFSLPTTIRHLDVASANDTLSLCKIEHLVNLRFLRICLHVQLHNLVLPPSIEVLDLENYASWKLKPFDSFLPEKLQILHLPTYPFCIGSTMINVRQLKHLREISCNEVDFAKIILDSKNIRTIRFDLLSSDEPWCPYELPPTLENMYLPLCKNGQIKKIIEKLGYSSPCRIFVDDRRLSEKHKEKIFTNLRKRKNE